MALVRNALAKHGAAFFAHDQTDGKGQRGKKWTTSPGENIILSVIFEPENLKPWQSFYLSASVAIACYDLFKYYAGHETSIKWPNDIYWRDRKAGGILIENIIQNDCLSWSIVGIGININQTVFHPDLPNPISLRQITGKSYNPVSLAKQLCLLMQTYYSKMLSEQATVIDHYNKCLYKLNESVRLRKQNVVFETILKGVSSSGKLTTIDSMEREFEFGEVEWIL
jgi:BirA family biotin operon repressor/biotin-[acetyl-CoA-carboxylase] ligase